MARPRKCKSFEICKFWATRTFTKTKNRVAQGLTVFMNMYLSISKEIEAGGDAGGAI